MYFYFNDSDDNDSDDNDSDFSEGRFDIEDIVRPEHEINALRFKNFINVSHEVDVSTLEEYVRANGLGFSMHIKQVITIHLPTEIDPSDPLTRAIKQFNLDQDKIDQQSAGKTILDLFVFIGDLNPDNNEALIQEEAQRYARENVKITLAFEPDTDEQALWAEEYQAAYQRVKTRRQDKLAFLNPDKLWEIETNIFNAFDSYKVKALLDALGGKMTLFERESDPTTLKITFEFT